MRMNLKKGKARGFFMVGAQLGTFCLVYLLLSACAAMTPSASSAPPPTQYSLHHLGPQDQWQLIYLKDMPAGLSHFKILPSEFAGAYRIESFFLLRYTLLGSQQENSWKGQELVYGNLDLQTFALEGKQGEDTLKLKGTVRERVLYVEKEFRGQKEQHRLSLSSPLKSSLSPYFMPLLAGPQKGQSMTLSVFQFDPQNFVGTLELTLEDWETQPSGKVVCRIRSQMMGMTSYAYVSPQGEVLEEQMLGGLLRSEKISAEQGEHFLLGQALAKTDLLLDFSLVPADKKIDRPETLKSLTLEMQGLAAKDFPHDARQKILSMSTAGQNSFTVKIEKEARPGSYAEKAESLAPYLAASPVIQSRDPKMEDKAGEIAGSVADPGQKARLLHSWVYQRLKKTFRESYTAREALEVMEGECQSHSKLFAALSRAAGLPAKVVNGLVYIPDLGKNGFLYHSWNEVYLSGRWVAVDPTLGQFLVDATHIKLTEGERFQEIVLLANTVGKLKIKIVGEER